MTALDLRRLREIGWTEWDPIGILKNCENWIGQPFENEYDHYLTHVADRAIAGDDDDQLISYLRDVESGDMGLGSGDCSTKRAAATVSAIRKYLRDPSAVRTSGWKT
ncbi:hypothetical protein GOB57_10085 [Sinorhizobium meliloti]|nr:hypothetical protein [Sinorhizobium meliloti]